MNEIGFGIAWLDWTLWTIGLFCAVLNAAILLWIWRHK